MNSLSTSSQKSLLVRTISALVMAAAGIPCVIFGGWWYFTIVSLVLVIGVYEFTACSSGNRYNVFIFFLTYAFTLCSVYLPFFFDENLHFSFGLVASRPFIPPFFLLIYFFVLFVFVLFSSKVTLHDATYLLTMGVYWSITGLSLFYVRYIVKEIEPDYNDLTSSTLCFYILLGSAFNDIGAYLVGILFGRHKMIPRISPHKTWEGFAGGIVFSFLFSFFFALIMDKAGYPILPGYLDFSANHWVNIMILSLLLPIGGDFGDLIFSAIKRTWGIKDFGNIIPGHGGVLDRCDSFSFCVIVVSILVEIFIGGFKAVI